jgi:hypothetical protein
MVFAEAQSMGCFGAWAVHLGYSDGLRGGTLFFSLCGDIL